MREQANVRTSQYTSFIKRERKIDYFWRSLQLMPIRRSDYSGEYLFILMLKFHSILSLIDDDIKLMSSGLWDFQRIVCVFFWLFFRLLEWNLSLFSHDVLFTYINCVIISKEYRILINIHLYFLCCDAGNFMIGSIFREKRERRQKASKLLSYKKSNDKREQWKFSPKDNCNAILD